MVKVNTFNTGSSKIVAPFRNNEKDFRLMSSEIKYVMPIN